MPETVPSDSFNDVALDPKSETVAGLVNYRFESPLVFFNSDYLTSRVRCLVGGADSPVRTFVIGVESITQMDLTAVRAVSDIHAELKAKGIKLLIERPKLYVRKYGELSGLGAQLGRENVFPSIGAAVASIALQDATEESNADAGRSAAKNRGRL